MGDLSKNFNLSEFSCRCGHYDRYHATPHDKLVAGLQALRDEYGYPITINSGTRCVQHNNDIKGSQQSSHIFGLAADIQCLTAIERWRMLPIAMKYFRRIGIGDTFIHLDVDTEKTQGVIWTYRSR